MALDPRLADLLGPAAARAVELPGGSACRLGPAGAWRAPSRHQLERAGLLGRLFDRFPFRAACLEAARAAALGAVESTWGETLQEGADRWGWHVLDLAAALRLEADAEGAWAMLFAETPTPPLRVLVPVLPAPQEAAGRAAALGAQALLVSEIDDESWVLALAPELDGHARPPH